MGKGGHPRPGEARIIERLAWFTGAGRCTCSGLTAPKENATWSIIYLGEIIPDRASRRPLLRKPTLVPSFTISFRIKETIFHAFFGYFLKLRHLLATIPRVEENLNHRDPRSIFEKRDGKDWARDLVGEQIADKFLFRWFRDRWKEGRGWKT